MLSGEESGVEENVGVREDLEMFTQTSPALESSVWTDP